MRRRKRTSSRSRSSNNTAGVGCDDRSAGSYRRRTAGHDHHDPQHHRAGDGETGRRRVTGEVRVLDAGSAPWERRTGHAPDLRGRRHGRPRRCSARARGLRPPHRARQPPRRHGREADPEPRRLRPDGGRPERIALAEAAGIDLELFRRVLEESDVVAQLDIVLDGRPLAIDRKRRRTRLRRGVRPPPRPRARVPPGAQSTAIIEKDLDELGALSASSASTTHRPPCPQAHTPDDDALRSCHDGHRSSGRLNLVNVVNIAPPTGWIPVIAASVG